MSHDLLAMRVFILENSTCVKPSSLPAALLSSAGFRRRQPKRPVSPARNSMKTDNPMNAQNKMMKKKKGMMKSGDDMSGKKDDMGMGMKKDGMK